MKYAEPNPQTKIQFTQAELDYLAFQIGQAAHSQALLFRAITAADEENKKKFRSGFPGEVDAVNAWRKGDLAKRMRLFGPTDCEAIQKILGRAKGNG